MDYKQALKYLDSFVNYEKKTTYAYKVYKLQRIQELLRRLGDPQDKFRSIHIAGTKGKGSTCAILYSILRQAGYKVGLYTSPHLLDFRERIRVSCGKKYDLEKEMIPKKDVCHLLDFMKPHIKAQNKHKKLGNLSFFEVYTAMAFLYFAEKKVDYAVVEVGLGGRLDATNVLKPRVCGITHIGLDHTSILGDTVEKIAREKAGIIKQGVPAVCARQEKSILDAIKKVARDKGAEFVEAGNGLEYKNIKSDLLGVHQLENMACAVKIARIAARITRENIKVGIAKVNWPGRLQILSKKPLIVLDGAHNRSSAVALKRAIKQLFPGKKIILIFGISMDKDIKGTAGELFPTADKITLTKAKNPRAASPEYLGKLFHRDSNKIIKTNNVPQALRKATSLAGENAIILATGSFYVVGEAYQALINGSNLS